MGRSRAKLPVNTDRQLRSHLVPQYFEHKPLEHLLGDGIKAEDLNDDCLGYTLDWLYDHDVTRLFAGITHTAREKLGISSRLLHVDTTSFTVSGAYIRAKVALPSRPFPRSEGLASASSRNVFGKGRGQHRRLPSSLPEEVR